MARDPIPRFAADLIAHGILTEAELADIDAGTDREIAEAIEFARGGPDPDITQLTRDVYTETAA
jgi:pyruvate dehydrogenase E1 component alpha subunit